jgi:hypothetical protein
MRQLASYLRTLSEQRGTGRRKRSGSLTQTGGRVPGRASGGSLAERARFLELSFPPLRDLRVAASPRTPHSSSKSGD